MSTCEGNLAFPAGPIVQRGLRSQGDSFLADGPFNVWPMYGTLLMLETPSNSGRGSYMYPDAISFR